MTVCQSLIAHTEDCTQLCIACLILKLLSIIFTKGLKILIIVTEITRRCQRSNFRIVLLLTAKLKDNRRYLEAACLLTDYANVSSDLIFTCES